MSRHQATRVEHADALVARLDDCNNPEDRVEALEAMGKLKPATLAHYADAVVACLAHEVDDEDDVEDDGPYSYISHYMVRATALKTLGKLEPATLAQFTGAEIAMFEDHEGHVVSYALTTACKLDPAILSQHFDALVCALKRARHRSSDNEPYLRRDGALSDEGLEVLSHIEPATLAQHAELVDAVARKANCHEPASRTPHFLPRPM